MITAPEGDGTQDAPSALAMFDVICSIINGDEEFSGSEHLILIMDNAGTYSADVFSVAAFDIARSHGLKIKYILHNEAQDGKTELDSWFFHFKRQLTKWMNRWTLAVLTPSHMAEAMGYSTGVKGMRFDIVCLDRPWLESLFGDKGEYYGALKNRMKQALPRPLLEVRAKVDSGECELYLSSASAKFAFNNGAVRMVDEYLTEVEGGEGGKLKRPLVMGYAYFKEMRESLLRVAQRPPPLPDLPPTVPGELMTKTTITTTVLPPDRPQPAAPAEAVAEAAASSDESEEEGGPGGGRVKCPTCRRTFFSAAFLDMHTCRPLAANGGVEARAVRFLGEMIGTGEAAVHGRDAYLSCVAPPPALAEDDESVASRLFPLGWAKQASHGKTKGHRYMDEGHKVKCRAYFDAGEEDKGKKNRRR